MRLLYYKLSNPDNMEVKKPSMNTKIKQSLKDALYKTTDLYSLDNHTLINKTKEITSFRVTKKVLVERVAKATIDVSQKKQEPHWKKKNSILNKIDKI